VGRSLSFSLFLLDRDSWFSVLNYRMVEVHWRVSSQNMNSPLSPSFAEVWAYLSIRKTISLGRLSVFSLCISLNRTLFSIAPHHVAVVPKRICMELGNRCMDTLGTSVRDVCSIVSNCISHLESVNQQDPDFFRRSCFTSGSVSCRFSLESFHGQKSVCAGFFWVSGFPSYYHLTVASGV